MPLLENFPSELILHIYSSCSSVEDVLNLSLTCRRLHHLLPTSQRLSILFSIMENEAGPIFDIVQFLTLNSSQPAHIPRQPSPSLALLQQVISVSRVARKWEEYYPQAKWQDNFTERRALNTKERFRLRRAIYRLWLFSRAFHNTLHTRQSRLQVTFIEERSRLVRNWSTEEIAEMEDFRNVMRIVLRSTYERDVKPQFELLPSFLRPHYNHPSVTTGMFHSSYDACEIPETRVLHTQYLSCSTLGYTCEPEMNQISQYYVLEDLMKLDPGEVMWLQENSSLDWPVQVCLQCLGKGEWFENNGETLGHTIQKVLSDRGEDVQEIRERIGKGDLGVVERWEDPVRYNR